MDERMDGNGPRAGIASVFLVFSFLAFGWDAPAWNADGLAWISQLVCTTAEGRLVCTY